MGGYTSWHRQLEAELAQLKGTEEALLFPTGYAANLAVASALCQVRQPAWGQRVPPCWRGAGAWMGEGEGPTQAPHPAA